VTVSFFQRNYKHFPAAGTARNSEPFTVQAETQTDSELSSPATNISINSEPMSTDQALADHMTVYSVIPDQHVTSTVFRRIFALLLLVAHVVSHDMFFMRIFNVVFAQTRNVPFRCSY